MKTGGTSLRKMLISELGEKAIFPNDTELNELPHGWYPSSDFVEQQSGRLREHKILIGHHPFSLCTKLDKKYKPVIFLREPISRTISMMGHRKRNSPELAHLSDEELLDNKEFVENQILNYQTKILSMKSGHVNLFHHTTHEDLNLALENIKHLAFIGIHEYFFASCSLFDKLFHTGIAKHVLHENVNPSPRQLSEGLLKKIKPLIILDELLYSEALKQFHRDRIAHHIPG